MLESAAREVEEVGGGADHHRPGSSASFPTRHHVLSDQELKQVLVTAKTLGAPWRQFIWTLAATGQRLREVSMMTRDELRLTGVTRLCQRAALNGRAHNVPAATAGTRSNQVAAGGRSVRLLDHAWSRSDQRLLQLKDRVEPHVRIATWRLHNLPKVVHRRCNRTGHAGRHHRGERQSYQRRSLWRGRCLQDGASFSRAAGKALSVRASHIEVFMLEKKKS